MALFACLAFLSASAHATTLYVFLPGSNLKPRALQSQLSEAMPTIEVTVFGRASDFGRQCNEASPDAVLAPGAVLKYAGHRVLLHGQSNGKVDEALVALGREAVDSPALHSHTLGVLDLFGRGRTEEYLAQTLSLAATPTVKRVAEPADLLTLIQLDAAQFVIVGQSGVDSLLAATQQKLIVSELPAARQLLPSVSVLNETSAAEVTSAILGLSPQLNKSIHVESWSQP